MCLGQMMMDAVRAGSAERVSYAISLKCSVNCSEYHNGDTPLHVAGKEMKPNVFGFLLLVSEHMLLNIKMLQ
jgi:hypothetical protein